LSWVRTAAAVQMSAKKVQTKRRASSAP